MVDAGNLGLPVNSRGGRLGRKLSADGARRSRRRIRHIGVSRCHRDRPGVGRCGPWEERVLTHRSAVSGRGPRRGRVGRAGRVFRGDTSRGLPKNLRTRLQRRFEGTRFEGASEVDHRPVRNASSESPEVRESKQTVRGVREGRREGRAAGRRLGFRSSSSIPSPKSSLLPLLSGSPLRRLLPSRSSPDDCPRRRAPAPA